MVVQAIESWGAPSLSQDYLGNPMKKIFTWLWIDMEDVLFGLFSLHFDLLPSLNFEVRNGYV